MHQALDGPTFVTGFRVGEELPFGALASGPASLGWTWRRSRVLKKGAFVSSIGSERGVGRC